MVAPEGGELRIASGLAYSAALERELSAFISSKGHIQLAGAGEHDDLVLALALAMWWLDVSGELVLRPTHYSFGRTQ
jgi:hypothetical protein